MNALRLVPILLLAATVASPAFPREWSNESGTFKVEGEFVELKGDLLIIRNPTGRKNTIPLNALRPEDQEFARQAQVEALETIAPANSAEGLPENSAAWFIAKAASELSDTLSQKDRDFLLAEIACLRAARNERDVAEKYLAKVADTAAKDRILVALTRSQAEGGAIEQAQLTARRISDDYLQIESTLVIAQLQLASGDKGGARKTYEAARVLAMSPSDKSKIAQSLMALAANELYGDRADKLDALDEAAKVAKRNKDIFCLERLPQKYAALGEVDRGKSLAQAISHKGARDAALYLILREQILGDDLVGAKATLKLIKTPALKSRFSIEVAAAGSKGNVAKAKQQALRIAESYERVPALCGIARAQVRNDDVEAAAETLATAAKVVESMTDERMKAGSLKIVIAANSKIIETGQSDEGRGVEWALRLPASDRASVLSSICSAFVEGGMLDEAKAILAEGRLGDRSREAARNIARAEVSAQAKPELPAWIAEQSDRLDRAYAYLGCADAAIVKESDPAPVE